MFSIIGIVVVFGSIVAGYLMEHGNLKVLMQPAELIIIGGAAAGTVLTANPLHILKEIASGVAGVFGSSKFGKQRYTESLKMMYELLNKARKEGLVALESDIEEPEKSALFSNYKDFVKNHHALNFVCDTMRMAVSGGVEVFDLDQMLDSDMEVHHHEATEPVSALSTMADSLPGYRRRGVGRGHHHGRVGRTSRRDWTQSGSGVGGNVPGYPAVLRAGGSAGGTDGQDLGRRARVSASLAGGHDCVSEGDCADHGG